MKKVILALMLLAPLGVTAQNTWEMIEEEESDKANPDAKYLAGAVTEEDGKVVFQTVIDAPSKSKQEVYDIVLGYMTKMTKEKNQFEQSRIAISDKEKGEIAGTYQEWLVFKSSALSLDRTRLLYNLVAECEQGKVKLRMIRIHYLYDEERDPQAYVAEEWITDKYGLNKKQNKLARISGKFRRKTIDRKDFLFNKIASLLK